MGQEFILLLAQTGLDSSPQALSSRTPECPWKLTVPV